MTEQNLLEFLNTIWIRAKIGNPEKTNTPENEKKYAELETLVSRAIKRESEPEPFREKYVLCTCNRLIFFICSSCRQRPSQCRCEVVGNETLVSVRANQGKQNE